MTILKQVLILFMFLLFTSFNSEAKGRPFQVVVKCDKAFELCTSDVYVKVIQRNNVTYYEKFIDAGIVSKGVFKSNFWVSSESSSVVLLVRSKDISYEKKLDLSKEYYEVSITEDFYLEREIANVN